MWARSFSKVVSHVLSWLPSFVRQWDVDEWVVELANDFAGRASCGMPTPTKAELKDGVDD